MTIRELAAFLGVRLSTAYGLAWDGTIRGVKQDGAWVIDRESAEAYRVQRDARRERIRRSRSAKVIDVKPTIAVSDALTTATGGATGRAL